MTTTATNRIRPLVFLGALLLTALAGSAQSSVSVATGYNNSFYSNSSSAYGVNSIEVKKRNDSLLAVLVADLTKDHLISDKQKFTFRIDKDGMTVNGDKQTQDVYDRYFKKYAPANSKETNWTWTYVVAP